MTEVGVAAAALILATPVMLFAALGILCCDPGPILYRAQRVGKGGRVFTMYKFRTMRSDHGPRGQRVTAPRDARVSAVGRLLRRTKVDELPQLYNVLVGEMALVGPRPEDPEIVRRHYRSPWERTLDVRPGMASPGSIFEATHGDRLLADEDALGSYLEVLLPIKMALELAYLEHASPWYDLRVIGRAASVVVQRMFGRREFPMPPEWGEARRWLRDYPVEAWEAAITGH